MPRAIVLGNGESLVCLDRRGLLRDFYFHYVGLENHVGGRCLHRIGVMVDNTFSWLIDGGWIFSVNYKRDSLVSDIKAVNESLEIELNFEDCVYNEKSIFIRRVIVKNLSSFERDVKIFFHQEFRIYDTERGDTGYYDPDSKTLIHYEGRRVFLIGAMHNGKPFEDFSVGNYGIEGKEGTWKDAEDGVLERNAVEYAFVDSVLGFNLKIGPRKRERIEYWITASKDIESAKDLNDYVLRKTPEHLVRSTRNFWKAWSGRSQIDFRDLDEKLIDLFKKSLLIMRTHVGSNGGIIASGDSDMLQYGKGTYAYVWPRDAAFIVCAFDKVNYSNLTKSFFDFCNDTISREGYFFHKYLSDKSVGSSWHPWFKNGEKQLAIQEEETALVIYSLWKHYRSSGDIEFIEKIYNSLIKKAGDFMVDYRFDETGLPKPSYDIWEQDYGVSCFGASTVYGGLVSASNFAELLGKSEDASLFLSAAQEVKSAINKYFYNENEEFFYKMIKIDKDGGWEYDQRIDASSFFGIFKFGVMDKNDPILKRAYKKLKEKLLNKSLVGGVFRYEGDEYHRISHEHVPNPWFITTLWCAQYEIATANELEDLKKIKKYFDWCLEHSLNSGVLAEQIRSDNGQPMSATPLIWSHAEYVTTVTEYLERFEDIGQKINFSVRKN